MSNPAGVMTVIRRPTLRALCGLVLLTGLTFGGSIPGEASDPSLNRCAGTSTAASPRSCAFVFKGFPFRFHATSSSPGTARVWVTLDGYPETYALPGPIGCVAEAGRTSCSGGYPDETTVLDLPHQGSSLFLKLRCHFAGAGATWEYGCQAGS